MIAFYKDIFAVIYNFLEVSSLLDSNRELDLFASQLIYFEPRINAFVEQFIKQWNFQQTTHRYTSILIIERLLPLFQETSMIYKPKVGQPVASSTSAKVTVMVSQMMLLPVKNCRGPRIVPIWTFLKTSGNVQNYFTQLLTIYT